MGNFRDTSGGFGVLFLALCFALFSSLPISRAQTNPQKIETIQIRPNLFMIAGAGCNITVQTGPDGAVLVDSGDGMESSEVVAEVKKLTDQPIRYIINTGSDPDHVGGNEALARAGRSIFATGTTPLGGQFGREMTNGFAASILAPDNVLARMSAPTGQKSPYPSAAWPNEPFDGPRAYIYFNHEGIEVFHQPAAHSDADSLVFFRASDVIATGEILNATRFPVIDVEKGGGIQGEISALNRILELSVRPIPFAYEDHGAGTYIIPAHGRIYQQADVVEYRDMVVTIRDIIEDMIQQKMSLEQVEAAFPAKAYEREYGAESGPWTTNDFVEAVYKSLSSGQKK